MGHYRFRPLLETKQGFTAAFLIDHILAARDVITLRWECDTLRYRTSTFTHYCSTVQYTREIANPASSAKQGLSCEY
jgi:hypothetical protein